MDDVSRKAGTAHRVWVYGGTCRQGGGPCNGYGIEQGASGAVGGWG